MTKKRFQVKKEIWKAAKSIKGEFGKEEIEKILREKGYCPGPIAPATVSRRLYRLAEHGHLRLVRTSTFRNIDTKYDKIENLLTEALKLLKELKDENL